tara:strand:- start:2009 stop:2500 length:492 start_codon:yes stop_codon:yes gene_type:complete
MHIIIKKRNLTYDDYKVKCAVGKRGIGAKKREGDLITPKGKYKILKIFYRADRVTNLRSKISQIKIKKNMGWCDDPRSNNYNKLIRLPFTFKSEKLYRKDNVYDIILVLNYNINPIRKAKGSAIFIHISKKNFSPTRGCVAIKKVEIKKLVKNIDKKTIVKII